VSSQLKVTGAILTKKQMEWEVESEVEVMDNGDEVNTEPTSALTIQGTTDCQPRETQVQKETHDNLVHMHGGEEAANPAKGLEVGKVIFVEGGVIEKVLERSEDEGRTGMNKGKAYLVSSKTPIFACRIGQQSEDPNCTYARCVGCFVEPSESGNKRVRQKEGRKRKATEALKERKCCHDMPSMLRYWESGYFNQERYRRCIEKHMPTECAICGVGFYDKLPPGKALCEEADGGE